MKVSAEAYPIQGLIKYHGLKDFARRIPYHDSISICTAPTKTHTTVEFTEAADDVVEIDGKRVEGRERERVLRVVDELRRRADSDRRLRMVSQSNFPKYVGLGSSASGFAALALAAGKALQLRLAPQEVSEVARLGAGSATRSVTGGISEWVTERDHSYGRCLVRPKELPWATVAVVAAHDVPTEGVHREAMASPFFAARLEHLPEALRKMRTALQARDPLKAMALAEQDTLNLHAVTMTMPSALLAWRGVTVETMHAVRALRKAGTPCYFSVDTGATVYVNTLPEQAAAVEDHLRKVVGSQASLLRLEMGPEARVAADHLF